MNVGLLLLGLVFLMVLAMALLVAAAGRGTAKSEGFAFFLIGPLPVFLRGKPWVALIAAAAFIVFLLLVMLR